MKLPPPLPNWSWLHTGAQKLWSAAPGSGLPDSAGRSMKSWRLPVRQFDSSSADVTALMSDLNICLRRLNDTFAELRLSFDDTASAFSAVNILSEDG